MLNLEDQRLTLAISLKVTYATKGSSCTPACPRQAFISQPLVYVISVSAPVCRSGVCVCLRCTCVGGVHVPGV